MDCRQTTEEKIPVDSVAASSHESGDKVSPMAASIPGAPPPVKLHVVTDFRQKVYNPGAIPSIPLRIPRKHSDRSMSSPYQLPYRASSGSSSTITSTGYMSSPYLVREKGRSKGGASPDSGDLDEKQWFAHRKRSRRFLMTIGVVTVVILVTLAIALPLGLRNKVSTQGRQIEDDDDSFGALFPAGSFLFKTSLQKTEAGCTSKNTTWTCGTGRPGESSVFYWDILQLNQYTYTITSTDNPFGPDFQNVSMKIRDYNQPTERFEFSFLMNKTVTPSDAGSPTNRAAKCTYIDTTFQATLYTRKRGSTLVNPPRRHAENSAWPGDVQIVQSLGSTVGQPMCRDASNNLIADVAAGIGTCQCQFGSANS
ncbi:hypothetical protein E4U55_002541 [Claviceps digitariae]|nr:hypothetical protein E4U55_002541 [Claviceps digitariae]